MKDNDWPEHHEELGRKTMNVLSDWTEKYQAGRITKREYFIIVSVLYDATSGLMEHGFSEILAKIHAELRRPADPPRKPRDSVKSLPTSKFAHVIK